MGVTLRSVLLGSLLALALLVAVPPGYVVLRSIHESPPVRDGDLRVERPEVPDEANGYLPLERAADALAWSEEEEARWKEWARGRSWDDGTIAETVAARAEALRLFREAADAPAFQTPPFRHIDDDLPDMLRWMRVARVAAIRGILRARTGDPEAAFADLIAPIRLGQRVQGERGITLIHAMIGKVLKDIGLHALAAAAPDLEVAAPTARAWTDTLLTLRTDPEAWADMLAGEYQVMRASYYVGDVSPEERWIRASELEVAGDSLLARGLPAAYVVEMRPTLRLHAAAIRAHRDVAGLPCRMLPEPPPDPRLAADHPLTLLRPNGIGRRAILELRRNLHDFSYRRCGSDSRLAATATLLALRAHAAEKGHLPESLDALVPGYLSSVPRETFTGGPLRYEPQKRRLAAVGSALVEMGEPSEEDTVLEIAF